MSSKGGGKRAPFWKKRYWVWGGGFLGGGVCGGGGGGGGGGERKFLGKKKQFIIGITEKVPTALYSSSRGYQFLGLFARLRDRQSTEGCQRSHVIAMSNLPITFEEIKS